MLFRKQKQDYDLIVEEYLGIIKGKEKVVFIKTGKGGTYRGYEDNYSKIAGDIYKMTGYSVAVSSNPVEYGCDLGLEIEYVSGLLDDYEELLNTIENDKCSYRVLDNVDHNFS